MSEQNKYFPLNYEQYLEAKQRVEPIIEFIPENQLNWIWNTYKSISGSIENQPCACGSSAGLWGKAVNVIREWIKQMEQTA